MKSRKLFALLLPAFFALCGCAKIERSSLVILHTNDVHGHILPERVAGGDDRELGGAAVLAGCVKAVREENAGKGAGTLLLDAGDFYLGTPEGSTSKGAAVIEAMNSIGYDALSPGNHDWDVGVSGVTALAALAKFPFLAANVIEEGTGTPPRFLKPYVVREFGPLRVGVIGVTIGDMDPMELPGGEGTIVSRDPAEYVRDSVEELTRAGVDFTVLVSHLGLGADKRLAREIQGLDVIIGGHQHISTKEPFRSPEGGTLICQAGSHGNYLGKLSLEVDLASGTVARYGYELISLERGRCPAEPAVAAILEKWRSASGERFDEVAGYSDSTFGKDREGVAMLGELITDAMREATGARLAFNQRHGIRGPLLEGPVRSRDIYGILPFDDTLWTVKLTGRQVRGILERVLSFHRPDSLRFSGLEVRYDPRASRNNRLVAATCGGEQLDDAGIYEVAVNTYLAKWGFINDLVAEGSDLKDTGVLLRDMLAGYIRAYSPVSEDDYRSPRLIPVDGAAAAASGAPSVVPDRALAPAPR